MKYAAVFLLTMAVQMITAQNFVGESKYSIVMSLQQFGYKYTESLTEDGVQYIELCDPVYHSVKTWYFADNICYLYKIKADNSKLKSYKKAIDIVKHKQVDKTTWEIWEHGNVFITKLHKEKTDFTFTTVKK